MSVCKQFGKDKIIFLTKEDYDKIPDRFPKPENTEVSRPVLPNGDINWECRCLGSMPVGPCGVPFRDSYSCLKNSKSDPPGADCLEKFTILRECMADYPALYNKHFGDDDDDDDEDNDDDPNDNVELAHKNIAEPGSVPKVNN